MNFELKDATSIIYLLPLSSVYTIFFSFSVHIIRKVSTLRQFYESLVLFYYLILQTYTFLEDVLIAIRTIYQSVDPILIGLIVSSAVANSDLQIYVPRYWFIESTYSQVHGYTLNH